MLVRWRRGRTTDKDAWPSQARTRSVRPNTGQSTPRQRAEGARRRSATTDTRRYRVRCEVGHSRSQMRDRRTTARSRPRSRRPRLRRRAASAFAHDRRQRRGSCARVSSRPAVAATTSSGRPVPSSGWKRVRVVTRDGRAVLDRDVDQQRTQVVLDALVASGTAARQGRRQRAARRRPRGGGRPARPPPERPGSRPRRPGRRGRAGEPDVLHVDETPPGRARARSAPRAGARRASARSGRRR